MVGNPIAAFTACAAAGQAVVMPLAQADPLLTSLVNFGAMGVLCAVLFSLHVRSLKDFREEMQAERKQRQEHHEKNEKEFQAQRHAVRDLQQMVSNHHAAINVVAGIKDREQGGAG